VQQGMSKLKPLYDHLWQRQLHSRYLQVDETTIKVLETDKPNATHLGYYWVYNDPVANIPMFKYEKGRKSTFPSEVLETFKGYLQTDGYAGYNATTKREDIVHLACWAHARREFEKAMDNDKKNATVALSLIQQLYQIERDTKEMTPDQRKDQRLQKALPICNIFFKWVAEVSKQNLPKSQIGKACHYATVRFEELTAYLNDGLLQIDNNAVENSIRPVALGRKNYLFAKTHQTAQNAAMAYTFMALCKSQNVNPTKWLKYVLENINQTSIQNLETLMPKYFT
jgi:hypothetical protein